MKRLTKEEFIQKVMSLRDGDGRSFVTVKRDEPEDEEYLHVRVSSVNNVKVILINWTECDDEILAFYDTEDAKIEDELGDLYEEVGTEMPYLYFALYEK